MPDIDIFLKLATGGTNQKLWPWRDSQPSSYAAFTQEYVVSFVSDGLDGTAGTADDVIHDVNASPVGSRPTNGLGVRDVIGNVAEWTETIMSSQVLTGGEATLSASVYGGSFLGLGSAGCSFGP